MNTNGIQKVEKTFEIKGPKIITKPKALLVALFVPLLPFGGWIYYSEKCEAIRMLLRLGGKKIGLVECALYDVMILPTIVLLGSGVLLLAIPFMLWIAFSSKSFNIMLLPTTLQVPQIGLPIYSSTPIVIRPWANSTSVPYEDIENVFSGKSPVYGRYLCITRSSEVDLIFPFTLFESEAEQQLLEKMLLASIEARKSSSSDNIRSRASGDAHVAVPVTKKL